MKKQPETTIVIHDVKTGHWELNKLKLPLCNAYTPGLSTVMVVPKIDPKKSLTMADAVMLTSPGWFGYIKFGLTLLWWQMRGKYVN